MVVDIACARDREDRYMSATQMRGAIDDILRDPSWDTALRSDLNVPTTELVLGGNPQLLPCDAAWTALSDYTTVEFYPALLSNLQAQMRLDAPGNVTNAVADVSSQSSASSR